MATLNTRNGLPCDSVRAAHRRCRACGLVGNGLRPGADQPGANSKHGPPIRTVRSTARFSALPTESIQQTCGGYSPRAAKLKNGQLWFATIAGVLMVDPRHLPVNKLPPPVHIEQVIADHKVVSEPAPARR